MSPGNREIWSVYRKLYTLSREYDYRVYIFPIVCSEYYYIKSISNKALIKDISLFNSIVNKEYYFDSDNYKKYVDKDLNFEQYCKACVFDIFDVCVSNKFINPSYRLIDCTCCNKSNITLDTKVNNYLLEWLIRPSCSIVKFISVSDKDTYGIHVSLVNEYNNWVRSFRDKDRNNRHIYKLIKPLPKLG